MKGNLRGGCTELLRKVDTSSSSIDTYDWTRAATNAKSTNQNDGSNRFDVGDVNNIAVESTQKPV